MVAMSLYRGKLHRPPDVPREWPMPERTITLEQFRKLTLRRSQAISRQADNNSKKNDDLDGNGGRDRKRDRGKELELEEGEREANPTENHAVANAEEKPEEDAKTKKGTQENVDSSADVKIQESKSSDTVSDKEKRKQELEKKLQVLNEKKHFLVQMLKQIGNAEEEIKRRNAQSATIRSSVPLQAENAVDMSSVTRHVPKLSVEVNFGGDSGAESDATANHRTQGRFMHHLNSASPSAGPFTRPFHGSAHQNGLIPAPRTSLVTSGATATSSPSRFAPAGPRGGGPRGGHQHSSSLPPVSVPGTHFVASSQSPAASGGASSVFRDARLTNSS